MIPLSIPTLEGNEWKYVKECLDTGWISSAGSYVNSFEEKVASYVGSEFGIACVNGTAGLHIAQVVGGVEASDYVIVPNLTFVATVNSVKYTGAKPIFVDVTSDSWQMDLDLLETFLSQETELRKVDGTWYSFLRSDGNRISTIIPVHVLGNIGDMNRLLGIAKNYHLNVIEDSAEALGSYYEKKHAGTFGAMGVFSFNGNKIISTGGGGVIVTDDFSLAKKLRHLTTTAKINSMDYIHDDIGYNYRLVNVLAAIGLAQLEQLPEILANKKNIDSFYRNKLGDIDDISFQVVAKNIEPNCWLFTLIAKRMRGLLEHLNENQIQSRPFWMPMNQLDMFKDEVFITENNVASNLYDSCISIPSSSSIGTDELEIVCQAIKEFYSN